MEKSFQLEQRELGQLKQLEDQRTQALAMVGALSLDMEQARKNLETVSGDQRTFLRSLLSARGVEKFEQARVENGTLKAIILEPLEVSPPPAKWSPERTNGPIIDATKE